MAVITWRQVTLATLVAAGVMASGAAAQAAGAGPAAQVVALTNQARAKAGCPAVQVDRRLTAAAQKYSRDMVENGYFEHDSLDGRSFADREMAEGYPEPGGENIAYGQKSAREVMTEWTASPGHRRNIQNCAFTRVGVGLDTRGMYWTQDFGR